MGKQYQDAVPQAQAQAQDRQRAHMGPMEGAFISAGALFMLACLVWFVAFLSGYAAGKDLIWAVVIPAVYMGLLLLLFIVAGGYKTVAWFVEEVIHRDVTGDNYIGEPLPQQEQIRLIPVNRATPRLTLSGQDTGFEEQDLRFLVEHVMERGHAWRGWSGCTLPSGRVLKTYDDYRPFPEMCERLGWIVERGPRNAGRLVVTPDYMMEQLGL